ELRVPLGVEEVGRLEVGGEVLVPHVDARDPRRARERRALGVDGQLGPDLVELPLERPGEVANPRNRHANARGRGSRYLLAQRSKLACSSGLLLLSSL